MPLYVITAQGEEYTDKAGNRKRHSNNIGIVIKTKNGLMLKLTSIPVGWDGWAYLNEPNEVKKEGKGEQQQSGNNRSGYRQEQQPRNGYRQPRDDFEDPDIPF